MGKDSLVVEVRAELRVELQGQLLAQLILRCQGEVAITYTERELVMMIMQQGLANGGAMSGKGSIQSDCHKSCRKIVKYLTSSNP
jgi:hypothetical protein